MDMHARDPGVAVVRLRGETGSASALRVRSDLATALDGREPLVVDLSQVTSIDGAIVGVLIDALAECEKHERQLLLLLPEEAAPPVRRMFDLSGLTALLPVVRSWDEVRRRALGTGPQPAPGWTSPVS